MALILSDDANIDDGVMGAVLLKMMEIGHHKREICSRLET